MTQHSPYPLTCFEMNNKQRNSDSSLLTNNKKISFLIFVLIRILYVSILVKLLDEI